MKEIRREREREREFVMKRLSKTPFGLIRYAFLRGTTDSLLACEFSLFSSRRSGKEEILCACELVVQVINMLTLHALNCGEG